MRLHASIRFEWIIVTGGEFRGGGGQLSLLPNNLEVCIEDYMEDMARLAEEEMCLLAHMTRSCAETHGMRRVLTGPGRDRRCRVVGEQGRSYQSRQPLSGDGRNKRGNPSPSQGGS